MCNCQNCRTEGYFEYVNGFIPNDCIYKTNKRPTPDEEGTVFLTDEPDHIED